MADELQTKSTPMGDLLKTPGKDPAPAPAQAAEATPDPTPAIEAKPTEATPPPPKVEVPAPEVAPKGIIRGMQAERQKRQEIEAQLAQARVELESLRNPQTQYAPEDPGQLAPQFAQALTSLNGRVLTVSENAARRAHPDFNEKYVAFFEEAAKPENRILYDQVMGSDDPGEAAYQAGVELLVNKKYGTSWESRKAKLREEIVAELTPTIRASVEAEFTTNAGKKANEPTNILQGRAAQGANGQFRPTSMADMLSRR